MLGLRILVNDKFGVKVIVIWCLCSHFREIMLEYNDCIQRAQRLSAAHESYMYNDNNALIAVKKDDLLIYLRWLISHLHSTKRFNQYMRVSRYCTMWWYGETCDEGTLKVFYMAAVLSSQVPWYHILHDVTIVPPFFLFPLLSLTYTYEEWGHFNKKNWW